MPYLCHTVATKAHPCLPLANLLSKRHVLNSIHASIYQMIFENFNYIRPHPYVPQYPDVCFCDAVATSLVSIPLRLNRSYHLNPSLEETGNGQLTGLHKTVTHLSLHP